MQHNVGQKLTLQAIKNAYQAQGITHTNAEYCFIYI